MIQSIPIPAPGVGALRELEREASDAEYAARVASDAAVKARARSTAIQTALCAALGVPPGGVSLDLAAGCFNAAAPEPPPANG